MIDFLDVVRNFGDFPANGTLQPYVSSVSQPAREGAKGADMLATGTFDPNAGEAGHTRPRVSRGREYERQMIEATRLIKSAFEGNSYSRLMLRDAMLSSRFREAMSISDFPNLFGDVIDRAVLANYRETPYIWNMIANQSTVNDFRAVKRFRVDYGTASVTTPIEQGAQYPETFISDNAQAAGTYNNTGYYEYVLKKYGKRMPFFWETFINDDLNALKDTPARFGRAMRRSEERFVASLFANNTTFFNTANFKNIVNASNSGGIYTANNPQLSITSLAQAMVVISNQKDKDGEPIEIEAFTLVVPPSLKVTAQNILNADYFWANDQGGTVIPPAGGSGAYDSAQRLNVANWARNIVNLAVCYYLPIVDATYGNQGWYMFADPNGGRPALEFGKLRGHENPELFMKLPNSVAIGEGPFGPGPGLTPGTTNQNPMEGDFDTDAIHYKVRHVFGGTTIDPIMAVYSNGSGS